MELQHELLSIQCNTTGHVGWKVGWRNYSLVQQADVGSSLELLSRIPAMQNMRHSICLTGDNVLLLL